MKIKLKDIKTFIIDFKNILIAIIAFISIIVSFFAIFAKASDLRIVENDLYEHKIYQRLDYLDRRITDLEISYKCANEACVNKMQSELYREYQKKKSEKNRIENKILK